MNMWPSSVGGISGHVGLRKKGQGGRLENCRLCCSALVAGMEPVDRRNLEDVSYRRGRHASCDRHVLEALRCILAVM